MRRKLINIAEKQKPTWQGPSEINDCARMGARASASSWGELEPCGMRRRDHIRGPAANLELRRSAESELTFPADQMGSDQRARWNYFIQHEVPFRTRARAAQLCQGHTEETSDERSTGNPSSGLNWQAVLETALEDSIEITTAEPSKLNAATLLKANITSTQQRRAESQPAHREGQGRNESRMSMCDFSMAVDEKCPWFRSNRENFISKVSSLSN